MKLSTELYEPWPILPQAFNAWHMQYMADMRSDADRPTREPLKIMVVGGAGIGKAVAEAMAARPVLATAVIPVHGVITRYGGWYNYGTEDYVRALQQADADPQVGSIVLHINSPGGSGKAMFHLTQAIAGTHKPVSAYVDDMAASAAMGIAAATDHITLANTNTEVGSIGTYSTFADWAKYYEKIGLPVQDVYATDSIHKNQSYRDAQQGNMKTLQSEVDAFNARFLSLITELRPSAKPETKTGRMYYAEDAIRLGLADAVGSMADVVARIQSENSTNINTQTPNPMKFKAIWAAIIGLFLFSSTAQAEETPITEQHLDALDKALADATNRAASAEATVATQAKQIAELQAQADAAATQRDTLQLKVDALHASAQAATRTTGADTIPDADAASDGWNAALWGKTAHVTRKHL